MIRPYPQRLLLALCCMAAVLTAWPRKVRTGPARLHAPAPVVAVPADSTTMVLPADTITEIPTDAVRLSGFDKTVRSRTESFFATNALADSADIIELWVTLDYRDTHGRQLHKADHKVKCHIPAGQTRRLSVPSFDRQGTFYYHLSPAPRSSATTPFSVRAEVTGIVTLK